MNEGPVHVRRKRYSGKNPRKFQDKYKELNPAQYAADVAKVIASGKTPAGTHRPIMVEEVLTLLRPSPGEIAVECTLGGGGHARALLRRVRPGGRVIGIDADPIELPRTEAALRAEGFGADEFVARHSNFAGLHQVLAAEGIAGADMIMADLGVSSMQLDNPARGFGYREGGPLDLRMNPRRGEPASALLERMDASALAEMLRDHADEPNADLVAGFLKDRLPKTTDALDRLIRAELASAMPSLTKPDLKMAVRRALQALRIAVNDEFGALDALLRSLPYCLAPGGRVAILAFHSGEDRRVKKAFKEGLRAGVYSSIADDVTRASLEEVHANRRSSSAKLRWAIARRPDL